MNTTQPETTTTTNETLPILRPNNELDRLARLGQWLAATEGSKDHKGRDGMSAALRFYYAEQLELPATAVAELTVINGRLFIGAPLKRALAEKHGYRVVRKDTTDESCTAALIVAATGEELGSITFTIEQARKAGLIRGGSAWANYPARMLWQRASSYVISDFAPAVALGIASTDEIPEYTKQTAAQDADFEPIIDADLSEEVDIPWPDPDRRWLKVRHIQTYGGWEATHLLPLRPNPHTQRRRHEQHPRQRRNLHPLQRPHRPLQRGVRRHGASRGVDHADRIHPDQLAIDA